MKSLTKPVTSRKQLKIMKRDRLGENIIAVIPARGGSKGIPQKNIVPIAGKPLIAWSIIDAKNAGIDEVYVTTDCPKIEEVALHYGAKSLGLRSVQVSQDTTSTEDTLLEFFGKLGGVDANSIVLLMQPTSPIRKQRTIKAAFDSLLEKHNTTAFTVFKQDSFFWHDSIKPRANYDFKNRPRRQDLPESFSQYRETGSIYAFKIGEFLVAKNRLFGEIKMIESSLLESFEIDTYDDLRLAEAILSSGV